MSSAFHDVANLCWKIAFCCNGLASPRLLDTYEAERRERVTVTTAISNWLGALIASKSRLFATLRNAVMRILAALPLLGPLLSEDRFSAAPTKLSRGLLLPSSPIAGKLFPNVQILRHRPLTRFDDIAGYTRFAVVALGPSQRLWEPRFLFGVVSPWRSHAVSVAEECDARLAQREIDRGKVDHAKVFLLTRENRPSRWHYYVVAFCDCCSKVSRVKMDF